MEACKTLGADKLNKVLCNRYFKFSYCPGELTLSYGFSNNHPKTAIINDYLIRQVIERVFYLKMYNPEHVRNVFQCAFI